MADPRSKFVFKDVTVVMGNDDETGIAFIFIIGKDGAKIVSFPSLRGEAREITPAEVETFLAVTPDSETLNAIEEAWEAMKKKSEGPPH